jgi:SSS family solute:Na+ symporter
MNIRIADLFVIALYFGGISLFGLYFARRSKDTETYFLGNRNFPGWVIGISLIGTGISSMSFLAYPADAFKTTWLRLLPGFAYPLSALMGAFVFMPFYRRTRATSAFQYLERRFGPSMRMYGAFTLLLGQLTRISIILYLLSILIAEVTGLPAWAAVLLSGFFVSFYTVAGGIEAVIWTDVVQTVILIGGAAFCVFKIAWELPGGFEQIFEVARAADKFAFAEVLPDGSRAAPSWDFSIERKTGLMMLFVGLSAFMGEHACDQNTVQRYCAARSMKDARWAIFLSTAVMVPMWVYFMFLGTSLYAFYQEFPAPMASAILSGEEPKTEKIFPFFIVANLPSGMSGLVLAAVAAAAMSSLDSSINAISTVSITDFYRRWIALGRDERHYLRAARIVATVASAFMIIGAWILILVPGQTLQHTAMTMAGIMAGGLLGMYLLGFLTTRGDERAVGIAILSTIAWSAYMTLVAAGRVPDSMRLPVDVYYAGILGNIVLFVVGFALGCLLPKRERDLTNLTIWTQDRSKPG